MYSSEEFELIVITTSLPKGQHMLICGVYHPPLHNYQETSLRSCIIDLADSLKSFPDGLFVCGGIVNRGEWLGSSANIKGANKAAKI